MQMASPFGFRNSSQAKYELEYAGFVLVLLISSMTRESKLGQ